jgi:hypothetical protein
MLETNDGDGTVLPVIPQKGDGVGRAQLMGNSGLEDHGKSWNNHGTYGKLIQKSWNI